MIVLRHYWPWVIAGLLVLMFYFLFDPMQSPFMPQCFFHKVTGLQCMGCGSQRVIHSLIHGDIKSAWEANALMVVSLPFLVFLGWLEINRPNHPVLYRSIHSFTVIIAIAVILFLWFIIRNILSI